MPNARTAAVRASTSSASCHVKNYTSVAVQASSLPHFAIICLQHFESPSELFGSCKTFLWWLTALQSSMLGGDANPDLFMMLHALRRLVSRTQTQWQGAGLQPVRATTPRGSAPPMQLLPPGASWQSTPASHLALQARLLLLRICSCMYLVDRDICHSA